MDQYIIEHWEGAGIITYAFVRLVIAWWNRRSEVGRLKIDKAETDNETKKTENRTIEILMSSLQSALSSIQALQSNVDSLQAERLKTNQERIDRQNEIDRLKDDVHRNQKDAETVNAQMSGELQKLRGELVQAKTRISELERQIERKDAQIKEQDQKIALLKGELQKSEESRIVLQCEVDKLTERLNGKVDKPITDEITIRADDETNDPAPDISRESNQEG